MFSIKAGCEKGLENHVPVAAGMAARERRHWTRALIAMGFAKTQLQPVPMPGLQLPPPCHCLGSVLPVL